MEEFKIARINELAKIAKQRKLSDDELKERKALRQEFLSDIKKNLKSQLDNIIIVDDKEE